MKSLILAFDLGTTALKAALVSEDGTVVGANSQEYAPSMPAPGLAEMDPEVYWQALLKGSRQALSTVADRPFQVSAIGFSAQGQTFLPIDRGGKPLHPAIVWLDQRARGIVERWQSAWLTRERFHQVSGYPSIPTELTVFKIAWLLENVPAARQAWKFLWLPDAMIFRLTGETATDAVTARMGGLYNYQAERWEAPFLDAAGITPEQLPRVLAPGAKAGTLQAEAAEALGLPAGIPVMVGTNDQLSGAIGAGNVRPGILTETTGTALAAIATTPTPLDDPRLVAGRHAVPGYFYAMAYASTSAVLLTWLRDLAGLEGADYTTFLSGAATIPPGSEGITVLPHFMGPPAPASQPEARGAILGLTLGHRRDHLARAIMEACACLLRDAVQLFSERGLAFASVRSLGGAARSDLWLQIKADLLGIPVERPVEIETALLGAAMLAAVGAGQFNSLEEAAGAWYRPGRLFIPNTANRAIYEEVYSRYQRYSELYYG